jgi:hypothetical protein
LLDVGPDEHGQLPVPAVAQLEIVGSWLQGHGDAVYDTEPVWPYVYNLTRPGASTATNTTQLRLVRGAGTANYNTVYIHIFLEPSQVPNTVHPSLPSPSFAQPPASLYMPTRHGSRSRSLLLPSLTPLLLPCTNTTPSETGSVIPRRSIPPSWCRTSFQCQPKLRSRSRRRWARVAPLCTASIRITIPATDLLEAAATSSPAVCGGRRAGWILVCPCLGSQP